MQVETRNAVRDGVIRSATAALPVMFKLMSDSKHATAEWPDSILDVGAGEGWWSLAASAIKPKSRIEAVDLEPCAAAWEVSAWNAEQREPLPEGPRDGKWHMILCLEVAEHLTPDAGDWLVKELCLRGDRVAFSAAIPSQGGDGHINEQWPAYWQQRFLACGYTLSDPWRLQLWAMPDVEPWYAQNLLCARPLRGAEAERGSAPPRHFVHPAFYDSRVAERNAARGL